MNSMSENSSPKFLNLNNIKSTIMNNKQTVKAPFAQLNHKGKKKSNNSIFDFQYSEFTTKKQQGPERASSLYINEDQILPLASP